MMWNKQEVVIYNASLNSPLTHSIWGRNKLANMLQTTFSNEFGGMESFIFIFMKISQKFVHEGPFDNKSAFG